MYAKHMFTSASARIVAAFSAAFWTAGVHLHGADPVPVTLDTFIRAETDMYFAQFAAQSLGRFNHRRQPADIDNQDVVRMNRDTLYSSGVFDLAAGPVSITLPDPGKRFMSMQVISEDHYTVAVHYKPGRITLTQEQVGTRYVAAVIRILVDPRRAEDIVEVNRLQDAIAVKQSHPGRWEAPAWDPASQKKIREALATLGSMRSGDMGAGFGAKGEVDPVLHLIGTAIGWGGNPRTDAVYVGVYPKENDGKTGYVLNVRDVPVDGFWSVSVYNKAGFFEKNASNAYSINSITAQPNADGSFTIYFGGERREPNWLPITPGWNYTVRLYRPRRDILEGKWTFPEPEIVK